MKIDKKIILIGPTPPPMGGIARYCDDIMNSYLKNKYEIQFHDITIPIKYRPKAYTKKTNSNILIRDGIINVIKQIMFTIKNYQSFKNLIKNEEPTVVHIISCTGLGFWRNALFVSIAKKRNLKTIWHVVGEIDVFWKSGGLIRRYFIAKYLNKSDLIIVQSDGLQKITQSMTNTKVVTIYNGVSTNEFITKKGYASSESNIVQIVSLGVLGKRKGYFDLIKIAEEFKNSKIANIKFRFIGGGEIEKFNSIIKSKGLENFIRIEGQVSDKSKTEILRNSDIFVLATYAEGQPIALLEGLAAGLPVISTTVGSIPEIIKENNGLLFDPGDILALKDHIIELVNDVKRRHEIGKFNMKESIEKYSLNRVFLEIDQAYSKC